MYECHKGNCCVFLQNYVLRLHLNCKAVAFTPCISFQKCILMLYTESFLWIIIPLLHCSIFPEEIESLQLFDDKVSAGHQLLDLFWVCQVFILQERCLETSSEIGCPLRVLTAEIQHLVEDETHIKAICFTLVCPCVLLTSSLTVL